MKGTINIRGDHAVARTLSPKARKALLPKMRGPVVERRTRKNIYNPVYSQAMTLGWLLFPRTFPKQLASARKTPSITYSRQVNLNKRSQNTIEEFYNRRRIDSETTHSKRAMNIIDKTRDKLFRMGIVVNNHHANCGLRGKTTVFFEIDYIYYPTLKEYIDALPKKTPSQALKKKQASALIASIGRFRNEHECTYCHAGSP
ncbi:Uncharacterised protein [uncultured archaeon]|nr:Uncharacterised protein [uncultured archaeon]